MSFVGHRLLSADGGAGVRPPLARRGETEQGIRAIGARQNGASLVHCPGGEALRSAT